LPNTDEYVITLSKELIAKLKSPYRVD